MANLEDIGKRLALYLKYKDIGINKFGRMTGTSGAQISFIIKGKKYGVDKLLDILDVCKDLNSQWLMFGKGNMLKDSVLNLDPQRDDSDKKAQAEAELAELKIVKLQDEISNQIKIGEVKEMLILNLKSTIEILQESNRDLKEMVQIYRSGKGNRDSA